MLVSNLETNSFETELVAEIETEPLNNPLKQLFRDLLFCLFVQFFFSLFSLINMPQNSEACDIQNPFRMKLVI